MIKRIVNYLLKRVGFFLLFLGALHPRLLKIVHKLVYEFMASPLSEGLENFDFLNYGYADLHSQDNGLELDEGDEIHRLNIQLYHHVATAVPVQGLEVLEVGCGHGEGLPTLCAISSRSAW